MAGATCALLVAAALFGVTFPLVHDSLQDVEPFAYLALRFSFALLLLGPIAWHRATRTRPEHRRVEARALAGAALVTGVLVASGYATQTVGLRAASPSSSAFLTGLYVAVTPILDAGIRRSTVPPTVWLGATVATVGLYLITGADLGGFGPGEWWTLGCAVCFAAWIVAQGSYAAHHDPVVLVALQLGVVVLVCAPATAIQGVGHLTTLAWLSIVFTGVACTAIALPLQLWGQRRIPPSRAALVLLTEPVFAAVAGYVDGERLGAVQVAGAAVILVGIAIAELGPAALTRADRRGHTPAP